MSRPVPEQFVSGADAKPCKKQHTAPCADCPWSRKALPGWLGSLTAEDWIRVAHSEDTAGCHTRCQPNGHDWDCAGLAIYRANICKTPRDPHAFVLKPDRQLVFATPAAFREHHQRSPVGSLEGEGVSGQGKTRRKAQRL